MKKLSLLLVVVMALMLIITGCGKGKGQPDPKKASESSQKTVRLATATSVVDSGLLDYLLPELEKDIKYKVEVFSIGTGQAIRMGEVGMVDVIVVNFPPAEDEFMADGFGLERQDVMYNDYLLIGPREDPAEIKGEKDIMAAFKKMADKKAKFISRGDSSGTHAKELSFWEDAGVVLESGQEWYIESGQGMADTYRIADKLGAYTLIDRATYLHNKDKYHLEIMVEGDERMLNSYGVISVNPEKFVHINVEGAKRLSKWLVSEKGQKMIGEYGVKKHGEPLFHPDAQKQ